MNLLGIPPQIPPTLASTPATRPLAVEVVAAARDWAEWSVVIGTVVGALGTLVAAVYAAHATKLARDSSREAECAAAGTERAAMEAGRAAQAAERAVVAMETLVELARAEDAARIQRTKAALDPQFQKMLKNAVGSTLFAFTDANDGHIVIGDGSNYSVERPRLAIARFEPAGKTLALLSGAKPEEKAALRVLAAEQDVRGLEP